MNHIDGYQLLANAVIEQACVDYLETLCANHVGEELKDNFAIQSQEKFFRSDEFKLYTDVDGERLLNQPKYLARRNNYDIELIRKDRVKNPRRKKKKVKVS